MNAKTAKAVRRQARAAALETGRASGGEQAVPVVAYQCADTGSRLQRLRTVIVRRDSVRGLVKLLKGRACRAANR